MLPHATAISVTEDDMLRGYTSYFSSGPSHLTAMRDGVGECLVLVPSVDMATCIGNAIESSRDFRCANVCMSRDAAAIEESQINTSAWTRKIRYGLKQEEKAVKQNGGQKINDERLQELFKERLLNEATHADINRRKIE